MGEFGASADREVTQDEQKHTTAVSAAPDKRPPNRIVAIWRGDEAFDAGRPGMSTIHIDGHGREGPGPVDTLLAALATCAAIDVAHILTKRRTPPRSMEVETVGTRSEGVPRRLTHVKLLWRIAGAGIERHHALRAIDLAVCKYCSVRDSLDPNLPIESELELAE
jgi:putative redox protein